LVSWTDYNGGIFNKDTAHVQETRVQLATCLPHNTIADVKEPSVEIAVDLNDLNTTINTTFVEHIQVCC